MQLKSMTLLFTKDNVADIAISFYVTDTALDKGLWNIENNHILLTETMYQEWNSIRNDQPKQKKFFEKLEKISQFALTE